MVFVGCLWHNAGVRLRELLKLLGAGLTGGVLAARYHDSRRRRREYLLVRHAVANELRHQFHTVVLQALLPGVPTGRSDEWTELLSSSPSFRDEVEFFRRAVPDFQRRVGDALERLARLASEGSLAPTTKRRMAPDLDLYNRALIDILQGAGELAGQVLGLSEEAGRGAGVLALLREAGRQLREGERLASVGTQSAAGLLRALESYLDHLEKG